MRRLVVAVAAVLMVATAAPSASASVAPSESARATPSASASVAARASGSVAPSASASAGPSAGASASAFNGTAGSGQPVNPICEAEIIDTAGVLSGDDVEQLRSDASGLTQTTLLRIRTLSAPATDDLSTYEQQLVQNCGWAKASSPYLLIVVDTDDGRSSIEAAPALSALTAATVSAIEQTQMRAPFSKRDWTGGLGAGLAALDELVGPGAGPSASFDPSALASTAAPTSSPTPAAVGGTVVSPPVERSGGGFPALTVLLLVAVGLLVLGAVVAAVRRRSLSQPLAAGPGWPEPTGELDDDWVDAPTAENGGDDPEIGRDPNGS